MDRGLWTFGNWAVTVAPNAGEGESCAPETMGISEKPEVASAIM